VETIPERLVPDQHPFNIRAFRRGIRLSFRTNVTFFVGENGSGKSTFLEAIATCCGFGLTGGNRDHTFQVEDPRTDLGRALRLAWLPVSGRGGLAHLVLPATTLGLGMSAILVRLVRTSMIAALGEDFVRSARAKGAPEWRVVAVHALRNALLPVTTVAGLQAGALLAGAIITETIFAWPGLGRLLVQAIDARDYPLVQGCVLAIGLTYVGVNTATDLLHRAIDPRLRDAR